MTVDGQIGLGGSPRHASGAILRYWEMEQWVGLEEKQAKQYRVLSGLGVGAVNNNRRQLKTNEQTLDLIISKEFGVATISGQACPSVEVDLLYVYCVVSVGSNSSLRHFFSASNTGKRKVRDNDGNAGSIARDGLSIIPPLFR